MSSKNKTFSHNKSEEFKVKQVVEENTQEIINFFSLSVEKFKEIKERGQKVNREKFKQYVSDTINIESNVILEEVKEPEPKASSNNFKDMCDYLKKTLKGEVLELLNIEEHDLEHTIGELFSTTSSILTYSQKQQIFEDLFSDALSKLEETFSEKHYEIYFDKIANHFDDKWKLKMKESLFKGTTNCNIHYIPTQGLFLLSLEELTNCQTLDKAFLFDMSQAISNITNSISLDLEGGSSDEEEAKIPNNPPPDATPKPSSLTSFKAPPRSKKNPKFSPVRSSSPKIPRASPQKSSAAKPGSKRSSRPLTLRYVQEMNAVLELGMIKLFMLKAVLLKLAKQVDEIMNDISLELKIYYLNFFNSLTDEFNTEDDTVKLKMGTMYHNQHFLVHNNEVLIKFKKILK
ncbi:unnamed protein product [Moneuplotes crassus]|uniref:Uncharacterized protein n=2 Tax=Euplotes crassus TaxID=5936 RepID=A0AAD1UJZ2_EUPCR|nr:unnamed protein product [Moneuplotes crassus]